MPERLVDAIICRRFPWMVAVVEERAMRLVLHTDAPSPPRPGWSAVVRPYRIEVALAGREWVLDMQSWLKVD